MPELLDRITQDIQRRLEELRPLVGEVERLEAALQALGADHATTPPSATPAARAPASGARAARRRPRAPRGQNRERVLGVVRERPGATTAEIASVSGVQRTVVHGVLRKLQADGEVKAQDLPSGTKGWTNATADANENSTKSARENERE